MDLALIVLEAAVAVGWANRLMPNIWMDTEAHVTIEPEGCEILGLDIIATDRERREERHAIERKEQLAAIWVVVGVSQKNARAIRRTDGFGRLGRQF
jgi:hypothetical protein